MPLDRVVAIVNDEALTQYEVDEQKRIVLGQMKAQNVTPPNPDTLDKQVLERLITERALLQFAKETGVRVDDTQVERTIPRIAQDNKLTHGRVPQGAREGRDHVRRNTARTSVTRSSSSGCASARSTVASP